MTHGGRKQRSGFTLPELLISITLILVLISLLLPAVIQCREAARRTQCKSNLNQLGIALAAYIDAFDQFPAGASTLVADPGADLPARRFSWCMHLLPYLEQEALWRELDRQQLCNSSTNLAVSRHAPAVFQCPSAEQPVAQPVMAMERSHYAGCYHDIEAPLARDQRGVLRLDQPTRMTEIDDGLQHTLVISENSRPDSVTLGWLAGDRGVLRNTGTLPNSATTAYLAQDLMGGFSSGHPGIVHALFADGHIAAVSGSISAQVWAQFGHRADHTLLSDPNY